MTDKELEETIEWKERCLRDYMRIAEELGYDKKTQERQIDMMLDDLSNLLKRRKH